MYLCCPHTSRGNVVVRLLLLLPYFPINFNKLQLFHNVFITSTCSVHKIMYVISCFQITRFALCGFIHSICWGPWMTLRKRWNYLLINVSLAPGNHIKLTKKRSICNILNNFGPLSGWAAILKVHQTLAMAPLSALCISTVYTAMVKMKTYLTRNQGLTQTPLCASVNPPSWRSNAQFKITGSH